MTTIPIGRIRADITQWLIDHGFGAENVAFYTPVEWAMHGETMCPGAVLHVYLGEAEFNELLDSMGSFDYAELYGDWCDLLDSRGVWHELGYAWSAHLYRSDEEIITEASA